MDWQKYTVKEIEEKLFANTGTELDEGLLESLARDERSGVQKLLIRYRKLLIEEEARRKRWEKMRSLPEITGKGLPLYSRDR